MTYDPAIRRRPDHPCQSSGTVVPGTDCHALRKLGARVLYPVPAGLMVEKKARPAALAGLLFYEFWIVRFLSGSLYV